MAISPRLALQIAKRDRWHCRYTGEPVILTVLFQALSMVYPTIKYNKNHRRDATDPDALSNSLQIDHFIAQANKGTDDPTNYSRPPRVRTSVRASEPTGRRCRSSRTIAAGTVD